MPLGCHLPSVFSFGVWDALFCCLMSFFHLKCLNLYIVLKLDYVLLFSLHICQIVVLKVHLELTVIL